MSNNTPPTPGKDFCDHLLKRQISDHTDTVKDIEKIRMQGMILDELVVIQHLLEHTDRQAP